MVKVSVHVVTFNSAGDIEMCVESLNAQTFRDFQIRVLDNASTDDTLPRLERLGIRAIASSVNTGFSKAHNALIRDSRSEYVLVLNPDTSLRPEFIKELVTALDAHPEAGSASGKLLRMDDRTIDSTGIVMLRSQRHLDRGADQPDAGQFDRPEEIFGPSGAAGMYRRSALGDCAVDGEYFDEDFFAYREDADLAWRLRLYGWNSIYVPSAVARHRRRVTPERRSQLPRIINYHGVKNRWLLRINNMTADLYRRHFWSISLRDSMVAGYVLVREWSSIPAFFYILRHFPRLWRKRRSIQSRIRANPGDIARWFT